MVWVSEDMDESILGIHSFADIFFLNREPMRRVKNSEELIPTFAVPPAGE